MHKIALDGQCTCVENLKDLGIQQLSLAQVSRCPIKMKLTTRASGSIRKIY